MTIDRPAQRGVVYFCFTPERDDSIKFHVCLVTYRLRFNMRNLFRTLISIYLASSLVHSDVDFSPCPLQPRRSYVAPKVCCLKSGPTVSSAVLFCGSQPTFLGSTGRRIQLVTGIRYAWNGTCGCIGQVAESICISGCLRIGPITLP
jgi:hypothetical protein